MKLKGLTEEQIAAVRFCLNIYLPTLFELVPIRTN